MRSQVPLGTMIHASGSLSAFTWPAQAFLLVPQSFLPALTTPAHFSVSPLAARTCVAEAASPTASRLAKALWIRVEDLVMAVSVTLSLEGPDRQLWLIGCAQYRIQTSRKPHEELNLPSLRDGCEICRKGEVGEYAIGEMALQERGGVERRIHRTGILERLCKGGAAGQRVEHRQLCG